MQGLHPIGSNPCLARARGDEEVSPTEDAPNIKNRYRVSQTIWVVESAEYSSVLGSEWCKDCVCFAVRHRISSALTWTVG